MNLQDIRSQLAHLKEVLEEAGLFLERLEEEDYKGEKEREDFETDLKELLNELNIEL